MCDWNEIYYILILVGPGDTSAVGLVVVLAINSSGAGARGSVNADPAY